MSTMDSLFQALANSARRRILDIVKESPGSTVGEVCQHFSMSRIGVIKHLEVLTKAGLILSDKDGRTRRLYFNIVPIQQVYDRWTDEYSTLWARRLIDLQQAIGDRPEAESILDPENPSLEEDSRRERE